jgi:hypothetical protein
MKILNCTEIFFLKLPMNQHFVLNAIFIFELALGIFIFSPSLLHFFCAASL